MKTFIFVSFFLIPVCSLAQGDSAIVRFHNPAAVAAPKGYSHIAAIDLGSCTMLIISGQMALDAAGNLVGKNDLAKQTEQVFLNLKTIITSADGSMNDIVKTGIYMRDVSQVQVFRDVRNKFINLKSPPASTLVEVSGLVRDDLLIEIEATAIIPKK
ncbi:MAG: RidA family protein [Rhizobacter sp.]|nr:RidA family protein [Ferruginibacter sp.]